MSHLIGLEQRVDRHKYAPCRCRAKAGNHRLKTLVEVDGDPVTACEAQVHQAAGELGHLAEQLLVIQTLSAQCQRRGRRWPLRAWDK